MSVLRRAKANINAIIKNIKVGEYSRKLKLLEKERLNIRKGETIPISGYQIERAKHLRNIEAAFNFLNLDSLSRNQIEGLFKANNTKSKAEKKKLRAETKKAKLNKRKSKKSFYRERYYEYLKSDGWEKIRTNMISIQPNCQKCNSKYELQVHHKTYKNIFKENLEDLEILCKKCHRAKHDIK